jgi:hypothetical protein
LFEFRLFERWKFDGEEWVWVSGSNTSNQNGVYGEKGIPDSSNIPGGRYGIMSGWIMLEICGCSVGVDIPPIALLMVMQYGCKLYVLLTTIILKDL